MNLLSLPGRKSRPAPKHAAATAAAPIPRPDPFPQDTPGSRLAGPDFRREVRHEAVPAGPATETALFVPDFAVEAPPERDRPYAPGPGPLPEAPAGTAGDAAALVPATLLRAVPRDGGEGSSKEVLTGWPAYAGRRLTETGQRVPGLLIGGDGDVRIYLENASAEWQDRLICEAVRMRLASAQGAELVRLWDEHIAWAVRMRDVQAYGGFRAAPVSQPAPVAADGGAR